MESTAEVRISISDSNTVNIIGTVHKLRDAILTWRVLWVLKNYFQSSSGFQAKWLYWRIKISSRALLERTAISCRRPENSFKHSSKYPSFPTSFLLKVVCKASLCSSCCKLHLHRQLICNGLPGLDATRNIKRSVREDDHSWFCCAEGNETTGAWPLESGRKFLATMELERID